MCIRDRLEPGWAPDPTGVHVWRWWNGARWTAMVFNESGTDQRGAEIADVNGPASQS